jgi:hypothetical protein
MFRRVIWFVLGAAAGLLGAQYLRSRSGDGVVGAGQLANDLFDGAVRLVEKVGDAIGDRRAGGVGSDWSSKPF